MSLPFCNSGKNVTNEESNVLVKIMNLSFTSDIENKNRYIFDPWVHLEESNWAS